MNSPVSFYFNVITRKFKITSVAGIRFLLNSADLKGETYKETAYSLSVYEVVSRWGIDLNFSDS